MLELSDDAVRAIEELTGGEGGLRFVAHEVEDGSFAFDPSIASGPEDGDETVERGGARVFLDPLAAEKLADQVLEIESHGDHVHLDFVPRDAGDDDSADAGDHDGGPAAA
jgi:hypothetical protein